MKKEYFFIFAVALLIFAYIVDYISGPINFVIKNPYEFLDSLVMSKFPLTAVGIFTRSLGIFLFIVLLLSLFSKLFFVKAIATFLLAALFNLFAIQQIATGTRTVTIQWSLSLSYAGIILLLPSMIYCIRGFISPVIERKSITIPSEDTNL